MIEMEDSDSFLAAKAKLKESILKGQPAPAKVSKLKLKDIKECRAVFLHRWKQQINVFHVRSLGQSLSRQSDKPLSPLVVFWIGDAWCVIDGHHRLDAYRRMEEKRAVPVIVFSGTLEDAMLEAAKLNSKDKLAMSSGEKCEAAWRLTIGTNKSKAAVMDATGVSNGFVGKARKAMNTLKLNHPDTALDSLKWYEARMLADGKTIDDDYSNDDWRKAEAQKFADKLSETFGDSLRKHPELFYDALAIYSPKLLEYIEEYHLPAEDEDPFPMPEFDESPDF